jgi:hypothetical protein
MNLNMKDICIVHFNETKYKYLDIIKDNWLKNMMDTEHNKNKRQFIIDFKNKVYDVYYNELNNILINTNNALNKPESINSSVTDNKDIYKLGIIQEGNVEIGVYQMTVINTYDRALTIAKKNIENLKDSFQIPYKNGNNTKLPFEVHNKKWRMTMTALENTLKYIANELKRANNDSNSGLDVKKFEENSNEYWKELFNITKYETKNKKFGYTILTDGKSVVLQMRKPTQPEKITTEYTEQHYDNFLGIDPGIRALITSYDTNNKVIQVSTREYRHKSKMIYACKKREKWYKKWEHYEEWKLIPTIKTSKTIVMKEYFKYVFPRMQTFTEFHMEKGFRNLNFTSYCRSKATLAKICERISGVSKATKNVKTLVGFGDYSQQHGLVKSHPTTPILRLKRELRRYCKVVDIDEYKTSKTCSSCNKEIELYRNRIQRKKKGVLEPIAKMSNIHSVIRCKHNECKLCCMDRDINASKNILGLLLGQYRGEERPLCFKPEKIAVKPRKSDKRAKACNSPLLT